MATNENSRGNSFVCAAFEPILSILICSRSMALFTIRRFKIELYSICGLRFLIMSEPTKCSIIYTYPKRITHLFGLSKCFERPEKEAAVVTLTWSNSHGMKFCHPKLTKVKETESNRIHTQPDWSVPPSNRKLEQKLFEQRKESWNSRQRNCQN